MLLSWNCSRKIDNSKKQLADVRKVSGNTSKKWNNTYVSQSYYKLANLRQKLQYMEMWVQDHHISCFRCMRLYPHGKKPAHNAPNSNNYALIQIVTWAEGAVIDWHMFLIEWFVHHMHAELISSIVQLLSCMCYTWLLGMHLNVKCIQRCMLVVEYYVLISKMYLITGK